MLRGKWVLENLLGALPPAPPANAFTDDNTVSATCRSANGCRSTRQPARASRHNAIDPVGLHSKALTARRWRTAEDGQPVDASGGLPDGSRFVGVQGLETALLKRPEIFADTLAEKLLTYALGRGVEYYDGPAVRDIVRKAKAADYHFSDLILAIVGSPPFQMRTSQ